MGLCKGHSRVLETGNPISAPIESCQEWSWAPRQSQQHSKAVKRAELIRTKPSMPQKQLKQICKKLLRRLLQTKKNNIYIYICNGSTHSGALAGLTSCTNRAQKLSQPCGRQPSTAFGGEGGREGGTRRVDIL